MQKQCHTIEGSARIRIRTQYICTRRYCMVAMSYHAVVLAGTNCVAMMLCSSYKLIATVQ